MTTYPGGGFISHDGLAGTAADNVGVGVRGTSFAAPLSFGFLGGHDPVFGQDAGAYGQSAQQGVMGLATDNKGTGVYGGGTSKAQYGGIGVRGETGTGVGVQGTSWGSGFAASFRGNVEIKNNPTSNAPGNLTVTGDISLINGDCAEDFDVSGDHPIEPGTVMVLDEAGRLLPSSTPYDKKVAGVVSGAGGSKPAIILGREQASLRRAPIALVGKVYCKVDANYGPIEIGDLLTTSATEGHAMKAADPLQGFGAAIGKALRRLDRGQGLIPILVALQ